MAKSQLPLPAQSIVLKTPSTANLFQKRYTWVAIVLLTVGLALRLIGLGARPLWFDEVISAVYARQKFSLLLALNSGDNHPVGYYLALKGWLKIFGESETTIRLLSVLPAVGALWFIWRIGRRLFPSEPRLALVALALAVFSPFQIYFGQEARNYSLLEFFSLAAVWFWLGGLTNNRWWDWLGLGICGVLGLVCNLTMAFYLIVLGLYPLFKARHYWQSGILPRLLITGFGTGLISGLALLPKLTSRLSVIKGNFWIPPPNPLLMLRTFYAFLFGASEPERFGLDFGLSFLILLFSLGPALFVLLSRQRRGQLSGLPLTLWLLFGPIGLITLISLLFQPLYLDKALIGCAPFYYLLLAWAIFRPDANPRRGRMIVTALPLLAAMLLAISNLPLIYNGTIAPAYIARYDAVRVNDYLDQHAEPGDVVATASDITWLPLQYYGPSQFPPKFTLKEYPYPNVFPLLLETLGSDFMPRDEFRQKQKANRLWVVFEVSATGSEIKAAAHPVDLSGKINWFHSDDWQQELLDHYDSRYQRLNAIALDRVILVLYQL